MGQTPYFQRAGQQTASRSDTRRWIVALVVLIGSLAIYSAEQWLRSPLTPITGSAYVADGDTLTIAGTRIRLVDIDAPELAQTCIDAQGRDWPCGRQAFDALRTLLRGHDVTCQPRSRDQYGRVLAVCSMPDETVINAWMVQRGLAVTYDRAKAYGAQEADAKLAKRGIWAGTFTPPREWRRQHPRVDGERKD